MGIKSLCFCADFLHLLHFLNYDLVYNNNCMSKNVCHSFLRPPLDAGFHIPMHRTQQTQQQPTQVTRKGCSDRRKKGRDGRIIKKGFMLLLLSRLPQFHASSFSSYVEQRAIGRKEKRWSERGVLTSRDMKDFFSFAKMVGEQCSIKKESARAAGRSPAPHSKRTKKPMLKRGEKHHRAGLAGEFRCSH